MKPLARRRRFRYILSGVMLLAFVLVFVVRLVDVQVVRAPSLNETAEQIRSVTTTLYGARGDIVDSTGKVLATTVMRYDITLSPKQARATAAAATPGETPEPTAATAEPKTALSNATGDPLAPDANRLGEALGIPGQQVVDLINSSLAADPKSDFAYVKKQVDVPTYEKVRSLSIPWVYTAPHPGRLYPNGAVAGNLIGFVGDDGEAQAGLELGQNACVAGSDGEAHSLRSLADWITIPGTEQVTKEAKPGGTLLTSIDSDLQYEIQRIAAAQVAKVGAQWASVVVMEVKTGRIISVVDVPTVDPNAPGASKSTDRGSRSLTAPFEPGSTMKPITSAILLDTGKATPLTQVVAPGRFIAPGVNFQDSDPHGDLNLTLTGVLVVSSNTGISKLGAAVDDQTRYDYLRKFGFGSSTGTGFPAEEPGDLAGGPENWATQQQTKYASMWGQGITTTAVQMASAFQTLANGGVRVPPSIVDGCKSPDGRVTNKPDKTPTKVISPEAAAQNNNMLEMVYQQGWLHSQWLQPGYRVAAKTGTAQVADGDGGYSSLYFVSNDGYVPADDPRFVVTVALMKPALKNDSGAAAPIFHDVMSLLLQKYRVPPSGTSPAPIATDW
ncbi:MAG TPA: penicillin-binding protein 2 [Candidatus Lumbricidophila sp.]|nr:penicillin-binding protein 2 [Candidatus Lumbricidophila sp.]